MKKYVIELDFGMGNIRSLQKAFEFLGQPVEITSDHKKIQKADAILLPGDGAFGKAISEIKKRDIFKEIIEFHARGKPILGICIGFQILFSYSEEFGHHNGFGFLKGKVEKLNTTPPLPVPHIGWSTTQFIKDSALLKDIPNNAYFYYVHSYCMKEKIPETTAICNYGENFVSIIEKGNLFGVQFHPEKSQKPGLQLLKNFLNIIEHC